MIDTIKSEIRNHESEIRDLRSRSERAREFAGTEWLPLFLDGIKKAEQARSEDRARTIGMILSNVLLYELPPQGDYVEEMLRVATILDNTDAEVLRQIVAKQGPLLASSGALDENDANEAWHDRPPRIVGLSEGMITSVCAKLESLGLVRAVKPRETWYTA